MPIPILVRNKEKVRFALYIISALFILYFIYGIFTTASSIDENLLLKEKNSISNDLKSLQDLKEYGSIKPIDLNQELGGLILTISLNIIQIIFLVAFMLILYINEPKNENE